MEARRTGGSLLPLAAESERQGAEAQEAHRGRLGNHLAVDGDIVAGAFEAAGARLERGFITIDAEFDGAGDHLKLGDA